MVGIAPRGTRTELEPARPGSSLEQNRPAAMRPTLTRATVVGDNRVELEYGDGVRATLDFAPYLSEVHGPVVDPLKCKAGFATARMDHGVLTWATGFDICPDVLRYWCEQGRICSHEETRAHFESRPSLQAS
ncbi:MAG: DUF2442 domain-containing protein [Planctomycetia bacterium]